MLAGCACLQVKLNLKRISSSWRKKAGQLLEASESSKFRHVSELN
jgi:hypothetical protein